MHNPPRLLLVDDTPDNLALLEAILLPEGYETVCASSGEAALALTLKQPPDLVVLDVMMPGRDGFATCRDLRSQERTRFVPVILLTALTEVEDRIRGLDAGADDFISKPVHDELLLAKVRSLLRLKAQRDELDQTRRDFANMVVHDLRAPLHGILGVAGLLREDCPEGDPRLRLLDLLETSAHKVDGLITQFLETARLGAGQLHLSLAPVDPVMLVKSSASAFEAPAAARRIRLEVIQASSLPVIQADAARLDQAIGNLLQNALKFTPPGGIVTLRADSVPGAIRLTVEDTGPGLPAGSSENLFARWVQGESRGGGVGLGLWSCKTIVEAHGGSLTASSRTCGGALFEILIPTPAPGV